MTDFKKGDIVKRKSYGGDVYFKIVDIINSEGKRPVYVLKGLLHRLQADSHAEDLVRPDSREVNLNLKRELSRAENQCRLPAPSLGSLLLKRISTKPGIVVHLDSSEEFLDKCQSFYSKAGIRSYSKLASEDSQPQYVRYMLEKYRPDILVVTGHDALKKNSGQLNSLDSYRNSRYFIDSVKQARNYEPSYDKLCIFAGACQSYYEGIMDAGANFASSPGRVLINALDPAIVAEKVALTKTTAKVTPSEIAEMTVSGRKGIWGIDTKGHLETW